MSGKQNKRQRARGTKNSIESRRATSRGGKPSDRRFTLATTMSQVQRLAGCSAFDLDTAAESASHHAPKWYGPAGVLGIDGCVGVDGLRLPWFAHGPRVFCNPPWSAKGAWVARAWQEWRYTAFEGTRPPWCIAMLLPATPDQAWWQKLVEPHLRTRLGVLRAYFLPGRPRYGTPEDPQGLLQGSPRFGSCLLVWGL